MTPHPAEQALRHWINDTVIGLTLCPFAAEVVQTEGMWIRVCEKQDWEELFLNFLNGLGDFIQADSKISQTGFWIASQALHDFEDFLDFLDQAESALADAGLNGLIQLASFHPDYVFANTEYDDPANWTNRSPHPTLHLIREPELEAALMTLPNPEAVPKRNQSLLRAFSKEQLAELKARIQR